MALSEEKKNIVKSMLIVGRRPSEVAAAAGVSISTVRQIAHDLQSEPQPQPHEVSVSRDETGKIDLKIKAVPVVETSSTLKFEHTIRDPIELIIVQTFVRAYNAGVDAARAQKGTNLAEKVRTVTLADKSALTYSTLRSQNLNVANDKLILILDKTGVFSKPSDDSEKD